MVKALKDSFNIVLFELRMEGEEKVVVILGKQRIEKKLLLNLISIKIEFIGWENENKINKIKIT